MDKIIEESGMKFGPFPTDRLLHIEKCSQYQSIQQGMKIAELVYYDEDTKKLLLLEAKTSAPNPKSKNVTNPDEIFQQYILDLVEKFENSLDLYLNLALKKELPDGFDMEYKEIDIVFVLVVKNNKVEWDKGIQEGLGQVFAEIHRINKIWKCKVLVLNEEQASKMHLIVSKPA